MFGYGINKENLRKGNTEKIEHIWVAGKDMATGNTLQVGRAQPSKQWERLSHADGDLCVAP